MKQIKQQVVMKFSTHSAYSSNLKSIYPYIPMKPVVSQLDDQEMCIKTCLQDLI